MPGSPLARFTHSTPRRPFLWALLAIVILGHLLTPYLLEPGKISQGWRTALALAFAVIVGLALATLTTLIYVMIALRDHPGTRLFMRMIGEYASIGAILGTLFGLRSAVPLSGWAFGRPDRGIADYLSLIGNAATVSTLLLIAALWWRLWAFFLIFDLERRDRWVLRLVILGANLIGYQAGLAVWALSR